MKVCPNCGSPVLGGRADRVFCDRRCARPSTRNTTRPARESERRLTGPTFVGVDGEGYTTWLGEHHYAMLSVGDVTFWGRTNLDFTEIAEFLWDHFDPNVVYVGFFLGYDFSQWLKTLPEKQAYLLLNERGIASRRRTASGGNTVPFPVRYEEWEFDLLGMKRFKLRKAGAKQWMYINDAGPFFQAPFMSVIDPTNWKADPVCTPEEYAVIREGKSHRADEYDRDSWEAAIPELSRYNVAENRVLSRVMSRYATGLVAAGVHLQRDAWYGPGAAAGAWLGNVGSTRADELQAVVPAEVLDFARESYYGGWFEVFAHGIVPGTSWEADITSAYPHAMSEMPDWATAEYTWSDTMPMYGLVEATVAGSDPVVGAMLHRRPDGSILRPRLTRGVYWTFELAAAVAAGVVDEIKVHRALAITVHDPHVLNREIPEMFKERLRVGKNTPHGKALKLIYNSAYGKQAQSIGSPKFASSLAASFITAHCRTAILRAIAAQPGKTKNVLMSATDGLYLTERPINLDEGGDLGQWEVASKERLTIVMPGVHYTDASREGALRGDLSKLRSRGINAQAFADALDSLDAGFTTLLRDPNDPGLWPTLPMVVRFAVTSPKAALAQGQWGRAGKVTRDQVRVLDSNPSSKRQPPVGDTLFIFTLSKPYLDPRGFVRTRPYDEVYPLGSTPYNKRFGTSELESVFGMSPDGPVALEIRLGLDGDG